MLFKAMNVYLIRALIVAFLLSPSISNAAFTLNGSRYIFNEGNKDIDMIVKNTSDSNYGGQIWVENVNNKEQIFFVSKPSFFKLPNKKTQNVNINIINESALPKDTESLFFINVQEIPAISNLKDKINSVSFALRTKVKLLYRPESISKNRTEAENNIELIFDDNAYYLLNPTPYYFAISSIKLNDGDYLTNRILLNELAIFKPNSSIELNGLTNIDSLILTTINDFGGKENYTIHLK